MLPRRLSLALACLVPLVSCTQSGAAEAEASGSLQVVTEGLRNKQGGQLIARLYVGEATWLEADAEFAQTTVDLPDTGEVALVFENVPYDRSLAVQLFHDKNNNGTLDFQWLPPKPKEGVGVSNNHTRMGPPRYKKAEIFLTKESPQPIEVKLRY